MCVCVREERERIDSFPYKTLFLILTERRGVGRRSWQLLTCTDAFTSVFLFVEVYFTHRRDNVIQVYESHPDLQTPFPHPFLHHCVFCIIYASSLMMSPTFRQSGEIQFALSSVVECL